MKTESIVPPSQQLNKQKSSEPKVDNMALAMERKCKDLERSQNGSMIMNERNLRIICENQGLYEYPDMNKKLYLHFKTIQKIQGLQKYTNLITLYLENNVIMKIEDLDHLVHLQNLFLQNNMIKRMQNLEGLKDLRVLNLSNNNIFKIEGIANLQKLQSLTLSNNYLQNYEDLEHLGQCSQQLTSIDLSSNKITTDDQMLNLIPQVKCLYLINNPLVRQTKHYRRLMVGTLKSLLYLDERGIDKEERVLAEAWVNGGDKGYRDAREQVLKIREQNKSERKEEIMKDIDVHRNRKILMFQRNIEEFEAEIAKQRQYMNQKGNEDMIYFYESKIAELMEKIRENQQFINNLNKRIRAAAKSIHSSQPTSQKSINSLESEKSETSQSPENIEKDQMLEREIPEDRKLDQKSFVNKLGDIEIVTSGEQCSSSSQQSLKSQNQSNIETATKSEIKEETKEKQLKTKINVKVSNSELIEEKQLSSLCVNVDDSHGQDQDEDHSQSAETMLQEEFGSEVHERERQQIQKDLLSDSSLSFSKNQKIPVYEPKRQTSKARVSNPEGRQEQIQEKKQQAKTPESIASQKMTPYPSSSLDELD